MVKAKTATKATTKIQVSSFGRYKSSRSVISTPNPKTNGYCTVKYNNQNHLIHRLIAFAFDLPKENDQTTVDHIDLNRSNNKVENLRWATMSEQSKYSYDLNDTRQRTDP